MNQQNMSTGFVHSIKVPRLYKVSCKILKQVYVDGSNFKSLISRLHHPNVQGIYALVSNALQYSKELDYLIDENKILADNPSFDCWLAKILITELLWGKKELKSNAKPIMTILSYKTKLQESLVQFSDATVDPYDHKKVQLPRYVRINTLLVSIDETLNAFYDDGWNLLPRCESYATHLETVSSLENYNYIQDFHIAEVLVFPPGTKFHNNPWHKCGKLLLQDKATCLPAFLLNPEADSEILDMCAAPGMKSSHLAAIINNNGKIYAVERDLNRYEALREFIAFSKAECITAINEDGCKISAEQYENVRYILVDPSCTGSGIVDRIEIREESNEDLYYRLRKLQYVQTMLLTHALLDFPNVKKVIYTTCSKHSEENEIVVSTALSKAANTFKLVNLRKKLKKEWHNFGSTEHTIHGDKCLYAVPEKDLCRGFFMAMFKRIRKTSDNVDDSLDTCKKLDTSIENQDNDNNEVPTKRRKKQSVN